MPRINADQVNAPADADLLSGGPGLEAPAEEEGTAELVEVTINGKKYRVDEETAHALEERELDFKRKLSEQAEDIRRRSAVPDRLPQPHVEEDDNLDTLLFEKPKEAIKKLKQNIINEVASAYRADQGVRDFWTDFNGEYPDLSKHSRIAKAILNERFNEWANLPSATARKYLADSVREEISGIVQAYKPADETAKKKVHVEAGGGSKPPAPKPKPEAPAYKSLSEVIAARRKSKMVGPARNS